MSPAVCELLLKSHVESLEDQAYLTDDCEIIVRRYLAFLCASAQQTNRLASSMVAGCAQKLFGVSPAAAKQFGDAMARALSFCFGKGIRASSGSKTTEPVKSVILSFQPAACLSKIQASLRSAPSSSSSTALVVAAPSAGSSGIASSSQLPLQESAGSASMDPSAIWAMYGAVPPQGKAEAMDFGGEVLSSQEVLDSGQEKGAGLQPSEEEEAGEVKEHPCGMQEASEEASLQI